MNMLVWTTIWNIQDQLLKNYLTMLFDMFPWLFSFVLLSIRYKKQICRYARAKF